MAHNVILLDGEDVVAIVGARPDYEHPANTGHYPIMSGVSVKIIGNNAVVGVLDVCIDERRVQQKFRSALL